MRNYFVLRFVCTLLAIFTGIGFLAAQDHIADSLEKELLRHPVAKDGQRDTVRFRLLNELSLRYKNNGQYALGHTYANEVIGAYTNAPSQMSFRDSFLLGDAYANKGLLYYRQGKNDSAVLFDNKAIEIWVAIHDELGYSMSLSHVSVVYDDQGDYPKALEYIFKALTIRQNMNDDRAVASMYGNVGEIYRQINDTAKAMEYHRKSLTLAQSIDKKEPDNKNNKRVIGNALNNIAILYEGQNDYKQSIIYHRQALKIRTEIGDKGPIAASLNNIGSDFQEQGQYDTALAYFQRAFEIKTAIGDQRGISICYLNFSGINFLKKDYRKAQDNLDSALYYCDLVGVPALKIEILRSYSEVMEASGNPGKALEWFKYYIRIRDSLRSEENTRDAMRAEASYTFGVKAAADSTRLAEQAKLKDLENEEKIHKQRMYTIGGVIGFLLMLVVAIVSFRAFRQKQFANAVITEQKKIVDEKQKEILDSINYAKKIQLTLLAHEDLLNEHLGEHFILFRPKDIVSGDFYWASHQENKFYLAVCDSTGHGVPGAFMSLLNISFLNEAINEKGISSPEAILNHVRLRLLQSVSKEGASDGMDGTLLCIDKQQNSIAYSSAFNTPVIATNGSIESLPADKMPIGKGVKENSFTLQTIHANSGSMLYLYTDGYADQFGGPKGKKFKYAQLNALLAEISSLPAAEQKKRLEDAFTNWRGEQEQVDDVCLIGIRL